MNEEHEYAGEDFDGEDDDSMQSDDEDGNGPNGGNRSYVLNENGQYERVIRKRKRKSSDQIKILMREFDRNPNWSKETLLEVSRKTGLSEAQVYKWGWD